MNNQLQKFKSIFPYVIAGGFVCLGIYLVLTHINGGIERDIGFANITFFTALILIGLTQKKQ